MNGGEGSRVTMLEEVEPSVAEVWRVDWIVLGDKIEGIRPRFGDAVWLVSCVDGGQGDG